MTESRTEVRYRPGLTWRSALALGFSLALVQPAMIYGWLVTGITGLGLASGWWPWIVILLWSELARFLGHPLSKQELFILLAFQWMASLYAFVFMQPIYNIYVAYSAESKILGISQYVPSWWVPSEQDAARLMGAKYVFLDPSWIMPVGVSLLSTVFGIMASISIGYFTYAVYVQGQNLDFPVATAQANTIITLAEREPRQMRIVMLAALFGILYNSFVSFLPYVLGPYLSSGGLETMGVSSPIAATYDMTPYLAHILPGAGFAFTLNIWGIIAGFLLPINITLFQFIGAISYYVVGTAIITKLNLWPTECLYNVSWGYYQLEYRAFIYFYASTLIGIGIAVTIVPLLLHWRAFVNSLRGISRVGGRGRGVYTLLGIFLISCLGSIITVYYLTGFPIWILAIFVIGGSLLTSFLSAASAGVMLSGINVPFLSQLMIYFSGWEDKAIWFAATGGIFGATGGILQIYSGGADIAMAFKQADILEARKSEYVKTYVVLVILGILSSLIFVSFLWSLSPIPSGAYPTTINQWPLFAADWARWNKWVWTGYLFRRELIFASMGIGALVYAITDLVLHQPSFLICFMTGATPYFWSGYGLIGTTSQLIGAIVANTFVKRTLEKQSKGYFDMFRGRFVIGFTVGWGFMETLRVLLVLISRAMWLLPY
ncbi:MAG: hypothetical protein ACUVTL_05020 [Thermoproteota archaeon]